MLSAASQAFAHFVIFPEVFAFQKPQIPQETIRLLVRRVINYGYPRKNHQTRKPDVFEVPNGTVINVDLNEYTSGVLAGEVYANWPEETLKAQDVAAGTIMARMKTEMTQPTTEVAEEVAAREAIHGLESAVVAIKVLCISAGKKKIWYEQQIYLQKFVRF